MERFCINSYQLQHEVYLCNLLLAKLFWYLSIFTFIKDKEKNTLIVNQHTATAFFYSKSKSKNICDNTEKY